MKKNLVILAIGTIILLSCTRAQSTQCGKAVWWKDIESNLVNKWSNSSKHYQDYLEIRSKQYDLKEAVLIDQNHGLQKGFCKSYFTAGSDKSCCTSLNYTKLINSMVRLSIKSAVPEQKENKCLANSKKMDIQLRNCTRTLKGLNDTKPIKNVTTSKKVADDKNQTIVKQPENNNNKSGFLDQNKEKDSHLQGQQSAKNSTRDSQVDKESSRKLRDVAEKAGKAAEAKAKHLMAKLAIGIARMLRGSLCTICGDPDKSSSLFDPSTQTWFMNQQSYENYTNLISQIFQLTRESNGECLDFLNYKYAQWQLANNNSTCQAASNTLVQSKVEFFPCENESDCKAKAQQCGTPLNSNCLDKITGEKPKDEDGEQEDPVFQPANSINSTVSNNTNSSNSNLRVLQQSSVGTPQFKVSENGGAIIIEDADDSNIQVAGQPVQLIQQQSHQTITQYENSETKANFTAALQQEQTSNDNSLLQVSNHSSLMVFGLFFVLLASTLF